MALHEKMKLAIIAEELFAYFMCKGYQEIDVSMRVLDTETIFTVVLQDASSSIKDDLEKDLYCSRELELEEYGWDLNIDGDSVDLLHNLSMLVDHYEMVQTDHTTTIVFHRTHH